MIIVKSGNKTRLGLISPFCAKEWSQLVINFECDLITWREIRLKTNEYTTLHYSTGNSSSSSTYLYYTLSLPSLSRLWWKLSTHCRSCCNTGRFFPSIFAYFKIRCRQVGHVSRSENTDPFTPTIVLNSRRSCKIKISRFCFSLYADLF